MNLPRLRTLAWITLLYTVAVIVWGALVRATGSGAGCGNDWPTCHGAWIPKASSAASFIEYGHRLTSGLAFLLVVALWLVARRILPAKHAARRAAGAALLLMVTESAVGAALVLLDLVADNVSWARAAWMALHLVNTNLLLGALALTVAWISPHVSNASSVADRRIARGWMLALLLGLLVVGITGAIAALGDTLFPVASLTDGLHQYASPATHLFVRLRTLHPVVALGVALAIVWGAPRIARGSSVSPWVYLPHLLVAFVALQVVGGLVNLLLLAPIWLQLIHLLLADAVWITLVLHGADALRFEQERAT